MRLQQKERKLRFIESRPPSDLRECRPIGGGLPLAGRDEMARRAPSLREPPAAVGIGRAGGTGKTEDDQGEQTGRRSHARLYGQGPAVVNIRAGTTAAGRLADLADLLEERAHIRPQIAQGLLLFPQFPRGLRGARRGTPGLVGRR